MNPVLVHVWRLRAKVRILEMALSEVSAQCNELAGILEAAEKHSHGQPPPKPDLKTPG